MPEADRRRRVVAALGGNALLPRGATPDAATQQRHARAAARALAPLAADAALVVTHGNGPQVGLLALERAASGDPFDLLDAETEGMLGYLIQQELDNALGDAGIAVSLVTQVEVDPGDPAFARPEKPVGPPYPPAEARRLAARYGWSLIEDGDALRRAVASPAPRRVVEIAAIEHLLEGGIVTVCAGGGGVPVVRNADGSLAGVEAVIDKDHASALLAGALGADALLLLTDVDAVYTDWDGPRDRALSVIGTDVLDRWEFAAGSMGPKVAAAAAFARQGGVAAIGRLDRAAEVLAGTSGTHIRAGAAPARWW
ncbi:MAG: carbamate kinase [Gammaproteobacteria bacterium]